MSSRSGLIRWAVAPVPFHPEFLDAPRISSLRATLSQLPCRVCRAPEDADRSRVGRHHEHHPSTDIQRPSHRPTTASNGPIATLFAAVTRPGSKPHQRCQRPSVPPAKFGQICDKCSRGQLSHSGYRLIQFDCLTETGAALQQLLVLLIQPLYLSVQPADVTPGRLPTLPLTPLSSRLRSRTHCSTS